MGAAFATVDQLANYLNRPIIGDAVDAATLALSNASDAIRALVKSELDQVTETDVLLEGNPSGASTVVLPPPYPVTAVTKVETLDSNNSSWTLLVERTDFNWTAAGILSRVTTASDVTNMPNVNWPSRPRSVRVSWVHGFATIPGGLVSICLSSAARQFTNPTGLIQRSIDGYAERFAPNTHGVDFTPAEERVLGYYREVTVA